MTLSARARALLAAPRIGRVAAALGVLFTLPCLWTGLVLDDQIHWARALGRVPGPRFDLFNFCDGSPGMMAELRRRGVMPWFAADGLRLAFFRPVTSITHLVDYNLWPNHPWIMHAESLAIYAGLVLVTAALYQRLLRPAWVAGLAAVSFAIEPPHSAVAWIAGRNGYLAPLIALGALLLHDRWRREGWRPGVWLSPALFLVALLAGEAAVGAIGYFLAYALVLERGPLRPRLASIVPVALVLGAWQVTYRLLGYGAYGSGLYLDPVSEPLRFLVHASQRGVALLASQLDGAPADLIVLLASDRARVVYLAASLVLVILVAWPLAALVRKDRVARFWALGALLSIPPVCAAITSSRLLTLTGVGAIAVLSQLVGEVADRAMTSRPARALRWFWIFHLASAPPIMVASSLFLHFLQRETDAELAGLTPPQALKGRTIVILYAPSFLLATSFFMPRGGEPAPIRHGLGILSASTGRVDVTRTDDATLTLRSPPGLTSEPTAALVASPTNVLHAGPGLDLPGMRVDVLESARSGWPSAAAFRFDAPLDDPRFYWVAWKDGRYVEVKVPPVGGAVTFGG